MSKVIPLNIAESSSLTRYKYIGYKWCQLKNQDQCILSDWVIWQDTDSNLAVGKVGELLQMVGSASKLERHPDLFLLWMYDVMASSFTIRGDASKPKPSTSMSKLVDSGTCAMIDFLVSLLHYYCTKLH